MIRFVVCSLLYVSLSAAHPQCLDYLPPFSTSSSPNYCSFYNDFTCCSSSQDSNVAALASNPNVSTAIASSQDPDLCMEYWKNVSCLRCSPYAAHLFDAEGYDRSLRTFPGICSQYCGQLYRACPQLADVIGEREEPFESESDFCEAARVSDVNYCYPAVEKLDTQGGRSLGSFGCLCVQARC